jgi:hypothetical protein
LKGGTITLFNKSKNMAKEETDEKINCNVCGKTLGSYKKCEHKKLCEECFSKINED